MNWQLVAGYFTVNSTDIFAVCPSWASGRRNKNIELGTFGSSVKRATDCATRSSFHRAVYMYIEPGFNHYYGWYLNSDEGFKGKIPRCEKYPLFYIGTCLLLMENLVCWEVNQICENSCCDPSGSCTLISRSRAVFVIKHFIFFNADITLWIKLRRT